MATTDQAQEYMATLHYLFDQHCRHVQCHQLHFDPVELSTAWYRLGKLGTEEVFADLDEKERAFFWICAFAMDSHDVLMWLSPSDVLGRLQMLEHKFQDGDFNNFLERMREEANDPVLTDD